MARSNNKDKKGTRRNRNTMDLPRVQQEFIVRGGVKVRTVLATEEGQHNRFWGQGAQKCDVMIVRIHGLSQGESQPTRTAILSNQNITRAHPQGLAPMFDELTNRESGVWLRQRPGQFDWLVMVPGARTRGTLAKITDLFKRLYDREQPVQNRPVQEAAPAPEPEVTQDPECPLITARDLQVVPKRFERGDRIRLGCGLNLGVLILDYNEGFEFNAPVLLIRTIMPEDGGPRYRTEIMLPSMSERCVANLIAMIGNAEGRNGKRREWEVQQDEASLLIWCRGTRLHLEDLAEMLNDRSSIDWPESVLMECAAGK